MMLCLAILLVLTCDGGCAIVYLDNQVVCSPGWIEVNERELQNSKTCIKLQHVKKSWADARRACQDDGGDLVKILTSTMNDEIMYQVSRYEGESFWFGLRSSRSDKYIWHWFGDPEEARRRSWFPLPPRCRRVRICGEIKIQLLVRRSWSHDICSEPKKFICQRLPIKSISFVPTENKTFETCSDGWVKSPSVNRSCIKLFKRELDWEAARAVCRSHGADLVQINDARMNIFIHYLVSKFFYYRLSFWVGLKKEANDTYFWVGHSLAHYFNWGQGQPNSDGNKTCVAIDEVLNRKWALKRCSERADFICEKGPIQTSLMQNTYGTAISCQVGWFKSPTTGTCLKNKPYSLPWFFARQACRAEDADLVKLLDGKMNKLIKETINLVRVQAHWIGLSDIYEEGSFHWLDEVVEPNYSNLYKYYLSIEDNGRDRVPSLIWYDVGRWTDQFCWDCNKLPFICEKLPGPSPCLDPDREGWFGHNCRHKCQCAESVTCNKFDGSCAGRCGSNRIGPSCQYELMRFSANPSFAWLRDTNAAICNNEGLDSFRITLDTAVHVNFIRLYLNDSNQLQNIEVIVNKLSHEHQQECNAIGDTTLLCNISDVIKEVKLSGSGVRHLCNYEIVEKNVHFQVVNKTEAEIAWLNDEYPNVATCNNEDTDVLNVTFDRPRKLSWITFYFNESDSSEDRSISITSGASAQSITHQCENPLTFESRTYVDVLCRTYHPVDQLHLRGPGVKLLCGISLENVRREYSSEVSSSRFSWLTDHNDTTCNHLNDNVVTVTLDTPIPLTWIRVVLETDTLNMISLKYSSVWPWGQLYSPNKPFARVGFKTFDLLWQAPYLVSYLEVEGPGVKDLCSLYISQGRNVALKEAARESSTVNARHTDPSFAVDGLEENGTAVLTSDVSMCALTAIDTPSWWMVTLSLEAYVHSFKISHQGNDNMRGFSIVAESKTGEQYNYTDNSGPPRPVYTVIPSPKISFKVQTVKIKAREGQPVSLCEVSILGETACPDGQFGLRCEWACNCRDNLPCFIHSGGCPDGCADGFHGENCYQPILSEP